MSCCVLLICVGCCRLLAVGVIVAFCRFLLLLVFFVDAFGCCALVLLVGILCYCSLLMFVVASFPFW